MSHIGPYLVTRLPSRSAPAITRKKNFTKKGRQGGCGSRKRPQKPRSPPEYSTSQSSTESTEQRQVRLREMIEAPITPPSTDEDAVPIKREQSPYIEVRTEPEILVAPIIEPIQDPGAKLQQSERRSSTAELPGVDRLWIDDRTRFVGGVLDNQLDAAIHWLIKENRELLKAVRQYDCRTPMASGVFEQMNTNLQDIEGFFVLLRKNQLQLSV